MMKKSYILRALAIFLLTLLPSVPAYAQKYVVKLSATQTLPGAFGVGTVSFTKTDFLDGVGQAQNPKTDATTLELVFDVGAKQFLVVRRVDGSIVTVVYALANDQALDFGSGDLVGTPSQVLRRADLQEPGAATVVGSITGLLHTGLDQPNVSEAHRNFYRWEASFEALSQTGGVFVRYKDIISSGRQAPMILNGQLKVRNKRFVATFAL